MSTLTILDGTGVALFLTTSYALHLFTAWLAR